MRRAGAFNGQLLDFIRGYIRPGISTGEIDRLVHTYTLDHGHRPATLGYNGFPKSCCTSINDVVCHGIPDDKVVLKEGDIINVDVTTIVDGYYGDQSETFMVGEVTPEARELVLAAARALLAGIDAVQPGRTLNAIGEAIEALIAPLGYGIVRQYTGHGIGTRFHEDFSVFHYSTPEAERVILVPGMTFTIEPMINAGTWQTRLDEHDKWTVTTRDGSLSAQFEHTIAVTETGAEVLTLTPSQRAAGKRLIVADQEFL